MTRTIIMLSGLAGSGKDYVAEWLVKNKGFTRFAFGDSLKDLVSQRYKIKRHLFDTQEGKKIEIVSEGEKISLRKLLITTAKIERDKNNLVFVDKVKTLIEGSSSERIVISDFRYPEEYTTLKDYFCNYYRSTVIYTLKIQSHSFISIDDPSETQLNTFPFDKIVVNCKSRRFDNLLASVFREY